jgi:hypothetical protein
VGIYLFSSQRTTNQTDVEVAEYEYKVLAREAAVTGINLTVRKLVADSDNWATSTASYGYAGEAYHGASFTVSVTAVHPDTVDLEATGIRQSGIQVINARYAKGYTTVAVPPAFKYAIISDLDLTLNGKAEILAVDDESNANIHANEDLTINGNKVHVEGYASFDDEGSGSGTVNPEKAINDVMDPNSIDYPIEDQPDNLVEGEYVDVPSLDPTLYDEIGESHAVIGGDFSFTDEVIDFRTWADTSGTIANNVGTIDEPFRLYINGDLTISGGVTVLGYAQIITFGSISISGNVTASVSPVPGKNAPESEWEAWRETNVDAAGNTTIGWYSNEDITVSGGSAVVGQLYANGTISLNGGGGEEMNIIGGVTSTNVDINVNGGVVIQYAEISEKVVIPGFNLTVPEGVRLIAWAEW